MIWRSRQILNQLANDKAVDVKVAVAKNPNTPGQSLIELASDAYEKVRSAVLQNPNVPGEVVFKLRKLLRYREDSILAKAATDPNTSSQTLEQLAQSNCHHIRSCVAGNPNTSLSTLIQLATDEILYVRKAVAKNPNATKEILIEVLCYQHKPNMMKMNKCVKLLKHNYRQETKYQHNNQSYQNKNPKSFINLCIVETRYIASLHLGIFYKSYRTAVICGFIIACLFF